MKFLNKFEWATLAFIFVYSFIPAFGGLFRIFELAVGLTILPENARALDSPIPIIIHILSSFVFCIVGALQFLPSVRRHLPMAHRVVGRVVAIAGCISAATGIWMTHFYGFPTELQGKLLYLIRLTLGFSMIGLIGWAVFAIKARNIFRHSASMLRAYAIGQGASTQAFLGIGWIVVFGTEPSGVLRDVLMVSAWGLNLLVAEVLIWKLLTPKKYFNV